MQLKKNIVANYFGQGWSVLMGVLFIPLYIKELGAESYGLIGFFSVLFASVMLIDFGLTPTLCREMARTQGENSHHAQHIRDLLRSVEFFWGCFACILIVAVWRLSGFITEYWLRFNTLSFSVVSESISIMGFIIAFRWLEQIYRAILIGRQDQVWLNAADALLSTARWGGAYMVLIFWDASTLAFFTWQGFISLGAVAILASRSYKILPLADRPGKFCIKSVVTIRRFASGMFVGSIFSFVLTQIDKLLISKLLLLDQLGYYMLATTLSGGILQLVAPINNAIYPHISAQIADTEASDISSTYLKICEWIAAVIVAPALVLIFFPKQILFLWTGNIDLTGLTQNLLSILAFGTLCNGLMNSSYLLQIAHGWTGLTVWKNLLAILIVVPALFWAIPKYGAIGAAIIWASLNLGYLLLEPNIVFLRLLKGYKWRWYKTGVIIPVGVGCIVAIPLKYLFGESSSRMGSGLFVLLSLAILYVAVIISLPMVRNKIKNFLINYINVKFKYYN